MNVIQAVRHRASDARCHGDAPVTDINPSILAAWVIATVFILLCRAVVIAGIVMVVRG